MFRKQRGSLQLAREALEAQVERLNKQFPERGITAIVFGSSLFGKAIPYFYSAKTESFARVRAEAHHPNSKKYLFHLPYEPALHNE